MPVDIGTIISIIFGSSLLTAVVNHFVTGYRNRRKERKVLIAKANASILKRVELYYRIRRRSSADVVMIKNLAHDIQEENEYYKCLLLVESRWYGERYSSYLSAVKELTREPMKRAWKTKGSPSADIESDLRLNHKILNKLSAQFSLDSRRFVCPLKRTWMAVHDKIWGVKKYDL